MEFYTRKPTRLPKFDYSSDNYYFVTICAHEKKCIFGNINMLNEWGKIAKQDLEDLSSHYEGVFVDCFVVMPNHIHAIIVLENANRSLSQIVGAYKAGVSRKIAEKTPVWQRSFYDHIIRSEKSYQKIWQYIQYNDQKWTEDCFYVSEE